METLTLFLEGPYFFIWYIYSFRLLIINNSHAAIVHTIFGYYFSGKLNNHNGL